MTAAVPLTAGSADAASGGGASLRLNQNPAYKRPYIGTKPMKAPLKWRGTARFA